MTILHKDRVEELLVYLYFLEIKERADPWLVNGNAENGRIEKTSDDRGRVGTDKDVLFLISLLFIKYSY